MTDAAPALLFRYYGFNFFSDIMSIKLSDLIQSFKQLIQITVKIFFEFSVFPNAILNFCVLKIDSPNTH